MIQHDQKSKMNNTWDDFMPSNATECQDVRRATNNMYSMELSNQDNYSVTAHHT